MVATGNQTLLLFMLLLLMLWLLTRVQRAKAHRPLRHLPITPEELGRVLFAVVTGGDLVGYKGLFLAGGETVAALGPAAGAYLEQRSPERLARAFSSFKASIPAGSSFCAFYVDAAGDGTLEIKLPGGNVRPVPVGSVRQVSRVWRLHQPASP